jgi:acetyltransferase-like isoleucine patch superfamily enzyme
VVAAELMIRKTRSAAYKIGSALRTATLRLKLRLLGVNVEWGRNVTVGRQVTLRTINGRIVIGDNVRIDDFAALYCEPGKSGQPPRSEIRIGSDSYIGVGVHITSEHSVVIGKGALIAAYCVLRDMNHGTEAGLPMCRQENVSAPITLGSDVWLGAHVVVTAGASIGSGAVIGANAVVTKDIPGNIVAVGLPARPIRSRVPGE